MAIPGQLHLRLQGIEKPAGGAPTDGQGLWRRLHVVDGLEAESMDTQP